MIFIKEYFRLYNSKSIFKFYNYDDIPKFENNFRNFANDF